MKTPLRAAVAAAAIAGAGLAGFGFSSAFAQTDTGDDATTTTEAPADASGQPPADCEGRGGPGLEAMAEVIGIDVEELHTALDDGQTPAEVAEANGVSRADLVDAIVADITAHIEQGVEDGHLTQAEADERLADVEAHAEAIVDGERPEGMGPGRGGPPPFGEDTPDADDATDTGAEA